MAPNHILPSRNQWYSGGCTASMWESIRLGMPGTLCGSASLPVLRGQGRSLFLIPLPSH